ncbi:MAG: 16S rRNA (cytidine(1402)-2'-O)-methyltransferase [Oscillospiraceae bacterium]|jgi:16S rRNA (cytidine1402-2'-O)-methyltransferase|nr:16S rRNA (cytidine(1402)-2'-O)-methyltransferase [Oscillospiraceae bacterium]
MLYLVGTPIGNLGDFSPRAIAVLSAVDFIAAEDTRVTAKLLHHFEVHTPMVSYHEHNKREGGAAILRRLLAGENGALVTDAGMPAISDPGEELIAACHQNGVPVESVPGPVAFATALALSGFSSGRFTFEGFLSTNKRSRRAHLESLQDETRTMLFYEAPHKLPGTLRDFAACFGERPLAIVRELTKIHEEVLRTTCAEAAARYAEGGLKGEMVLVLAGAVPAAETPLPLTQAAKLARALMAEGKSASEAAKEAARQSGRHKGEIYRALATEEDEAL